MIVLITTRGNGKTLRSLAEGSFGVTTPKFRIIHYERLFGAWRVPRATYIFGDLERLAPWELRLAADLYRTMQEAGLRCLNDPAKAMSRFELLTVLHSAGRNPFAVYRADDEPEPRRFPVFIRSEHNHQEPGSRLFRDQEELVEALGERRAAGIPLRGLLVVEQAAETYSDTLWAKWGTWRIGNEMIVEHIAVDDTWLVKIGDHEKITDAITADEHDAVASNRFADDIEAAFKLGEIEFGRADHGSFDGKTIVYEINTNPYSGPFRADKRPLRKETQMIARGRIAEALSGIDEAAGGYVRLPSTPARRRIRWWRPGFVTPRRP